MRVCLHGRLKQRGTMQKGWGIPAGAVETPTSIPAESAGAIKSAAAWMDTPDGDRSTNGMGEVGLVSPVAAMTDTPKGW